MITKEKTAGDNCSLGLPAIIMYIALSIVGVASVWILASHDNCIITNLLLYIGGSTVPIAVHALLKSQGWYKSKFHRRNRCIVPFFFAASAILCIHYHEITELAGIREYACITYLNRAFCYLLSYVCLGYIIYACRIAANGIKFDWHLIHGNFLRKTISLVFLLPFLFTAILMIFNINESDVFNEELEKNASPSLFWSTYYHFVDPGNQQMTSHEIRIWTTIVTSLGILLFNGLMITSIISWIERRKERWLKGQEPYKRVLSKVPHYIIIGGSDVTPGIVRQLLKPGDDGKLPYIIIQTSGDVAKFRDTLFSGLNIYEEQKVIVRYGNRTSVKDIKSLYPETAKEIYILGEDSRDDDIESYHDTLNMTCMRHIANIYGSPSSAEKRKKLGICTANDKDKITVHVMFEYQTTFNVMQITDIYNAGCLKFHPFNYYEMWAQNVVVNNSLFSEQKGCNYIPLEGETGIKKNEDSYVHIVIVGMSRMGTAMAIEAAHIAHYPNFEEKKKRTRITLIDSNMKQEMDFFTSRYSELFSVSRHRYVNTARQDDIFFETEESLWKNPLSDPDSKSPFKGTYLGEDFIDIEWEFIHGNIESEVVRKYLTDISADNNAKLTIAICNPENNRAVATAIYLPETIYSSKNTLQVLVYQRYNTEIIDNLNCNRKYKGKLKAFGMADKCYDCSANELAETISEYIGIAYTMCSIEKKLSKKASASDILGIETYKLENEAETNEWYNKWKEEYLQLLENGNSDVNNYEKKIEHIVKLSDYVEKLKENKGQDPQYKGKTKQAMTWSNIYNINSFWSKARCIRDGGFNPLEGDFSEGELKTLGLVEHNRWVIEQLLMHYSPLTPEEQESAKIPDEDASEAIKKEKKSMYKHLDICSNEILDKIDYNISEYDRELTRIIPYACRKYNNKNKNN